MSSQVIIAQPYGATKPAGKQPLRLKALKCDQLVNPLTIESPTPVLSWQMISSGLGKSQIAYRVIVSDDSRSLVQNKGGFWDSGKVLSSNSTQVIYKGKVLNSRQKVYWKVMVWDEKGRPSAWSEIACWQMGLLQPGDWQAKWIGATADPTPDSPITYPAPYFRKDIKVNKTVKQATVYVSGLGFYELYINGKKIGDQVLAPAVTNYDKRPLTNLLYPYDDQSAQRVLYNSFNVTENVDQQENTIGILLGNGWYNQRDRTVEGNMWYGLPKLIFQLEIVYTDGTTQTVVSDDTWKTTTGPLLKDGIFSGEQYDARLSLGKWSNPGYDDADWKPAKLVAPPSGTLHVQTAPFDKITRVLTPTFEGKVNDSVYRYHLDETVSGWASINVTGKAGDIVKVRYISEEGEDYGQRDMYILKGGITENWEPRFTWHAFRFIEITSKDVILNTQSIEVKDVHAAVEPNGIFECSNPLFNKINTAYIKTQLVNMHGSISSDCPHRERLGYTGDGQVTVESAMLSLHLPQFYQKWFNDMEDARNHKTGFVTHSAPFGGGGGGPAWGSAYVIMPWLYYQYYGDSHVLSQHYSGMKQWVEYLNTRTDDKGLIVTEEPNGWCLGDWCTPTQVELPEPLVNTTYFYHVTTVMAKVAALLNYKADKVKFERLAIQIKANFNKAYYNAAKKTYWQGRQGADVFALAFDLVPVALQKDVLSSLLSRLEKIGYHFDTGILATPLLLKVLSQYNRDDIAYRIMNQQTGVGFGYLSDDKNSTLWETWDGSGSRCHPMFGSVVGWFYTVLGGINPGPDGFQNFIIEPKTLGELNYCKSAHNSFYGRIRSEWRRGKNGNLEILVEIPVNTSATFVIPGNKKILKNRYGKTIKTKLVNGQHIVALGSGAYNLTAF
ncbi:glycoside hydrolase family 78 protein [Mucilaginibacter roseus]|uniref:alpha-L-rhamnosidase n=1 Tax=Mucilaginibacter roseus TaxID=1528868 RepID=A0ABS8U8P5_9SPHI|nr:family 78 glycoside hydrolase catalytic domain [Mucilaginibacter roseus]MCD8742156.1 glycoside hydrolase family 78 protein [Mucilaginibacter roseus]